MNDEKKYVYLFKKYLLKFSLKQIKRNVNPISEMARSPKNGPDNIASGNK